MTAGAFFFAALREYTITESHRTAGPRTMPAFAWKLEWKKLAGLLAVFGLCFWLPVGVDRFDNAVVEALGDGPAADPPLFRELAEAANDTEAWVSATCSGAEPLRLSRVP